MTADARHYLAPASADNAGMPTAACPSTDTIAVVDFETTGMGPAQGARATEIAVVLVRGGRIVDRYQNLMKTGVWIPPFITELTGDLGRFSTTGNVRQYALYFFAGVLALFWWMIF